MQSSWFYPKPTGDPGRDRNARTLQFTCVLFALTIGFLAVVDAIDQELEAVPILALAVAGFVAAAAMNRAGRAAWATRTVLIAFLTAATLLVVEARDGFRSLAMLFFPALLLISVMLLDRLSYLTSAGIIVAAVAALGVAETRGLTRAIPGVRSPTSYQNIFYVDLFMLVFATVGSRIARDAQRNVFDLRANIDQLSAANIELTKTAKALRESEERFRATFFQAAVGIAQTGIDNRWILLNDRFCEMLGYSQAELAGKTFLEVTHPDDCEASLTGVRQLLSAEISSWSREKRYIRKDAATVWARVVASLVRDQHDQPQYFITVVEDITEKVRADRALQEKQQQLSLALSTGLGVWECDLRAAAVGLSPQYRSVFGNSPLSYTEWMKLIHPDDRERVVAVAKQGVQRTHEWEAEFRVVWHDGTVRWMFSKGKVIPGEDHQPERMVGISLDVTERKQVEEQRLHLAAIVESSDVAIVGETVDGTIVSWNRGAEKLYGYRAEEVMRRHISMLVPAERQDRIPPVLERLRRGERIEQFETSRVRRDGQHVPVSLTVSPIMDSSGAIAGISAIARDLTEQKRAEAKLRESEERFRNMADSAPVMIWVSDPNKTYTFVNKPWLAFTGRSMDQELKVGWAEVVHPDDLDRCLATYTSAFDARREFKMEYRLRRADGEHRWVLENATPLHRGSEFAGYIGSCIDITEQKLIEEQLRASEAQLMDAQRLANLGSWDRDVATGRIKWSDEMYRVSGLETPPQTFPDYLETVHPKDRELVRHASDKARSGTLPEVVSYRILRPNGELRFVRAIVQAIRDSEGNAFRFVGAIQDITEQIQAQELLRESERRLKNAERLAHVGHWQWDLKSDQLIWSEECFRIFGRPTAYTPVRESVLQAMVPEDRERVERETRYRLAEQKGGAIEFRIVRPNGEIRTVRSVSEMLPDDEGQPAAFFGACQDITEAKRTEEESVARQKLESIGTLAGGIAHDFNNLLGSVLVQSELALEELAAGSNPEEELKAIHNVALRGSEIVRELMIYAGKDTAVVALVDVSQIVKEMLPLLKVSMSKHAMVQANLSKDLPAVRANASQLRQIVMNLITNASDAIGERDGVISLATRSVRLEPGSPGALSAHLAEGDYVELEVSDTGSGMSPEIQAKVFDPFFTTKAVGRGLGLSIVDRIVRNLDGAVHVTSKLGEGTTFQILVPCAETDADGHSDAFFEIEDLATRVEKATILIVEDEDPLREGVTKLLRQIGFKVFEARDGSSAIDFLRLNGGEIDLVLLDMTIPGASSREVIDEAAKVRPDIRVILTSAYGEQMVMAAMSAPQIRGFVRKPFQIGDLVKTLRKALPAP